jgi:hypothetical protein
MPTTTAQDRARNAGAARSRYARNRRFLRYADEIERSPDVSAAVIERLAAILRELGYPVDGPDRS